MARIDQTKAVKNQRAAVAILNELHERGFSSVLLDSFVTYRGGSMRTQGKQAEETGTFFMRVVVDRAELSADEMRAIYEVADAWRSSVVLHQLQSTGPSRVTLWVGV